MTKALFAIACALSLGLGGFEARVRGVDLDEARQDFIQGHYTNCIHLCQQAVRDHRQR